MRRVFLLSILVAVPCFAQTPQPATVQAQGSSTIYVQPDQAQLSVSITTNGTSAQDAGQQNATLTATVLTALQKVIGSGGTITTQSYNVYPRYSNGTSTQPAAIVGYTATITELVTINVLSLIGPVIDAANQAGATSVGGLSLGLQNPEPTLETALAAAAKQAVAHATSIAGGLGRSTGGVVSALETSTYQPLSVLSGSAGAAPSTNIQTGSVSVSANVTVVMQLQ